MNSPKEANGKSIWQWFNPAHRHAGSIGLAVNRIAGLGLVLYLFLHLAVLSQLAIGPQAYDGFVAMMKSPVFIFGEFLVVAAVLIHGLNGLRIALTSFGFGVRVQRQLLLGLMGVALIGAVIFGVKMFGG